MLATVRADPRPAAQRDAVLFELLLGAGPRIGSALAARVEDLHGSELALDVTKGSRPTRIWLSESVVATLRAYLGDRRSGHLFPGRGNKPLDRRTASERLRAWCRRAGIREVGPHALRHTFAMALYEQTRDIALVQAALSHRSIASTTVYARAGLDRTRNGVGVVGG